MARVCALGPVTARDADGATVDTGSGMKNGKLKSKDFVDVENIPLITFHSTKVEQTGPDTVVFDGAHDTRSD